MTSGRNPRHQSDVSEHERVYRILRIYRNAIDTDGYGNAAPLRRNHQKTGRRQRGQEHRAQSLPGR